jgi:hypothetical protein
MLNTNITEQSILNSIESRDYGLALSAAFSYLDGALGSTRGTNQIMMKQAIKNNLIVFIRAMMNLTEKEMPGGISNFTMLYNGKKEEIENILYDTRCEIQHEGIITRVEITENEINIRNGTVQLPLAIIRGIVAVANAIREVGA